ncbi:MAG TPA: hypothetical protein PLG63_04950 [bacterium]|nr:hypothetical protein [bacterium]HPG35666.1 hypothetical protein [bacterium]
MKKLVFLGCFLFLSVLLSANEKGPETENQTAPLFSRTKTEWVSIAAGYGIYGFEGDLTLFTFRWDRFFLETLKFHWGLKYRDTKANNIPRATIKFKTMLGFPLFLDKNNRNEIRFSGGMAVGYTTYEHRRENDFTIYFGSWIDIASEISYVLHISKHFALQIGASLDLPVYFVSAGDGYDYGMNLKYYRPDVYGFAGFRF